MLTSASILQTRQFDDDYRTILPSCGNTFGSPNEQDCRNAVSKFPLGHDDDFDFERFESFYGPRSMTGNHFYRLPRLFESGEQKLSSPILYD